MSQSEFKIKVSGEVLAMVLREAAEKGTTVEDQIEHLIMLGWLVTRGGGVVDYACKNALVWGEKDGE